MNDRTAEVEAIREVVGKRIFGAKFVKRDQTVRSGSFRLGVRKDLTGAGSSYDRPSRGNLTVFDMTKREYRTIRIDALLSMTVRGSTIRFVSDIVED